MRIILYGIGQHYKKYADFIETNFEVVGYIDKEVKDIPFRRYDLSEISAISQDTKIMVTSSDFYKEMVHELLNVGIGLEKICYMDDEIARRRDNNVFISYSQFGEDYVIYSLLGDVDYTNIRYLELGVDNPVVGNNTYGFELRGAKGWLVEANTEMIPCISMCRKNCTVINKAVVLNNSNDKEVKFYVADISAVSSLNPDEVLEHSGNIVNEIVVEAVTLDNLLKEIGKIDILSIDLEGIDDELLISTHFEEYGPRIICAETRETNVEVVEHLKREGYSLAYMNGVNAIWKKL